MSSRRDSSSKLLHKRFAESQVTLQQSKQLFDSVYANPLGTSFDKLFNCDDDGFHAAASRVSLRLDKADKNDAAMLRAFEAARLDHRSPLDWRILLSHFAEVHFGKIRTKPKKWDEIGLLGLFLDYLKAQIRNPQLKHPEIVKLLQTDKPYKSKYGKYNCDAFRKLVRHARSSQHNVLLRHPEMGDPLLQLLREDYESRGVVWDPELETNLKRLIEKSLEIMGLRVGLNLGLPFLLKLSRR